MARPKTEYSCTACDYSTPKWMGKCPSCKTWNSLIERSVAPKNASRPPSLSRDDAPVRIDEVPTEGQGAIRLSTRIGELDNVLGGGLVAGSLVLVGGDPGIGKSTLLLAAAHQIASRGLNVLYVSGEESVQQIRLRAERMGVASGPLHVLSHTDFHHIDRTARKLSPTVMILDSVQTVHLPEITSVPGSMTQVREVAHRAMVYAKSTGNAVILVGHVNKSGDLAGPKVLEHFVDTVLHFEGDGRSALRILRAVKNRFGPSGELGVFEMRDRGLVEVPDASARLLAERVAGAPGTAVVAAMEGSRALLAEVQALAGRPTPSTPARTCVGVDRARVLMLAAVLGKAGYSVHDRDLFVNAAGGVRLTEPAIDLGIVCAVASSLTDKPIPPHTLLMGEVGLVGEVRAVPHPMPRLKEAARHGFRKVLAPQAPEEEIPGLEVVVVRSVRDALNAAFA